MGNIASQFCNICLHPQTTTKDGYAYETFQKIPFFGPINQYLRKVKGFSPFKNTGGSGGNVPIGNKMVNPSPNAPSYVNPQVHPPQPFSFADFVKNIPTDIIKSQFDILNVDDSTYVRKIKKSNFDDLKSKVAGQNQLFTDTEFPPNQGSLGQLDEGTKRGMTWKRLKDILPNAVFINQKIQPSDILQGKLGDCYFLSALAALAQQQYRIKSIFGDLEINPKGYYMARVLHNGILQQVVVDDYFPVLPNGKLAFAQPSSENEVWVIVLQKCWAKLYGSYSNIVGGLPHEVLHAFSSAPVFFRTIPNDKKKQDALWNQILQNFNKGSLLCCGTKSEPEIEEVGFVKGHAYTILGVYDKPQKMIKIRNPWGHKQWKGRASDFDNQFWSSVTPAHKQALDYQDSKRKTNTDGIFFILWEDFLKYFQLVDICKINDNAHYNFFEGAINHLNPVLYEVQIGSSNNPQNKITLAVTQQNLRGKENSVQARGYSRSFLALGKLNSETGRYQYVASNSAKTFPDNYMELQNVVPGKYLWNNGKQKNNVTVSAYSAAPVVFKPSNMSHLQFLQQIFYDHASKNQKKKNLNNPGDWICSDMLLNNGGFGYLVVNIDSKSTAKLSVQIKQIQYMKKKMDLEVPYKNKGQILEEATNAKPLIVLFNIATQIFPSSITLPQPLIRPIA